MEYFKHDINASEDDKICDLLANGGYELFGYYWRFIEYLYSRGGKVGKDKLKGVAWSLHMEIEKLNSVINEFSLFVEDDNYIYSKRVISELQEFEENGKRMSALGKAGAKAKADKKASESQASAEACAKRALNDGLTDGEAYAEAEVERALSVGLTKENKINKINKIKENKINITNKNGDAQTASGLLGCEESVDDLFEEFWGEYPRKVNKQGAYKSFKKIKKIREEFPAIMDSLGKFKNSMNWKKDNGQYIPHPTTFLNGERWKDEVPIDTTRTETHSEKMDSSFDIDEMCEDALRRTYGDQTSELFQK